MYCAKELHSIIIVIASETSTGDPALIRLLDAAGERAEKMENSPDTWLPS